MSLSISSSTDRTVGHTTKVQFTVALSTTVFVTGDVLKFTIQNPGAFASSTVLSMCTSGSSSLSITSCVINTNDVSVTISVATSATGTLKNAAISVDGFTNPYSTTPISGNTAVLYSSGSILKESSSSATMTNFVPAVMQTASINPTNTVVGAGGTTIEISFTTTNSLKTNGKILVIFPYWCCNRIHMLEIDTPTCIGITVLKSTLTCSYNQASRTLTISNILSSDQVALTTMKFSITNVINPYSTAPRSGFTISTQDSIGGYIDQYTAMTYTVIDWGTLSFAGIDRLDGPTTVSENTNLVAQFTTPYPVDTGCKLRIDFPSDMPITAVLSSVSGTTLFQGNSLSFTPHITSNYVEIDGCADSWESGFYTQIYLSQVTNAPSVKQTGTFQFSLYDMVGSVYYKIGQVTSDIILQQSSFDTGIITAFTMTPVTSNVIQSATTYKFTIQPQHPIPTSSQIQVTLPSSITMPNTAACTISSTGGGMSLTSGCAILNNVLTLTNPFGSGSYTAGNTLSFTLDTIGNNPQVSMDSGTYLVSSFQTISGTNYAIDAGSMTNVFTPLPFILTASVASVSSYETYYSPSTYTLSITPNKVIPQNGQIKVVLPAEIGLQSSTLSSCSITKPSGTSSINCAMSSTNPYTISISDAFYFASYTSTGTPFTLTFEGLRNPRTTATTSSFQISTTDSSGNAIESITSGVTTRMTTINDFINFKITPSSLVNGAITQYQVSVTASAPLSNGDVVKLTFPSDITLPSSLTCSTGTSVSSVSCSKSGTSTVSAALQFSGTISSGSTFSFYVNNIQNPPSTKPSSDFTSISSFDSTGNQVSEYPNVNVVTTTPATVTSMNLVQSSLALSALTDYTVTYTPINNMASGAAFFFTYPNTISVSSSPNTCFVTYNSQIYQMTCLVDQFSRTVKVYGSGSTGLNSAVTAGQQVKITFGQVTNPAIQTTSPGTLTMTSYSDSTFQYTVDTITSGLVPIFECNLPCQTCLSSSKSSCVTCFTNVATINQKYLSGTTCVTACPAGTYTDSSFVCQPCSSKCATCDQSGQCLTCNTGGTYPLFYNNWCYDTCPTNTYKSGNTCIACNSNCQTCSGSPTYCTSCVTSSSYPILAQTNTCVSSCDSGYISVNGQCVKCTSPCQTCQTTQTYCLTCSSGYLLGSTCVSSCPSGYVASGSKCIPCADTSNCITCSASSTSTCTQCKSNMYLNSGSCVSTCPTGTFPSGTDCLQCSSNCQTCSGSAINCITCDTSSSLPILSQSNTCVSSCDAGYVVMSGKCQKCSSTCSTCIIDQSTCNSCSNGYLYGSTCVSSCPIGYVPSSSKCIGCDPNCAECSSSDTSKCLGCKTTYLLYSNACYKSCPYGYQPNNSTTQCDKIPDPIIDPPVNNNTQPNNTIPDYGNTIDDNETAADKSYVYFPVLITQTILTGVGVGSYIKDKASLPISGIVALYGPLEFIAYGGQAALAYYKEIYSSSISFSNQPVTNSTGRMLSISTSSSKSFPLVFYGTLFAFGILILSNLLWLFMFLICIKRDEGYKEYRKQYCFVPNCLLIIGCLFSHKVARFLYCRFFGQDQFYVPFKNYNRIHGILNCLTIMNIILTLLPIIFIDIYGLVKYRWGGQFYIIIIETLVLTITVLILSIIEFKASRKLEIMRPNTYQEVGEMSSIMEDTLMKKLEDQLRQRLGTNFDSILNRMKNQPQQKEEVKDDLEKRKLNRGNSMIDIGMRDKEEDDRRVVTDPLDSKHKKVYDSRQNPFEIEVDSDHPNNCYAEKSRRPKTPLDKSKQVTKVTNTGDKVMTGEEYEKEFDKKMRSSKQELADMRKDEKKYGKNVADDNDEDDKLTPGQRKKIREGKMRGRKDKFYEQVDDEDMSFAEDTERQLLADQDTQRDDDNKLRMIEEESEDQDNISLRNKKNRDQDDEVELDSERQGLTQGDETVRKLEDEIFEEQNQQELNQIQEDAEDNDDGQNDDDDENALECLQDDENLFEEQEAVGEDAANFEDEFENQQPHQKLILNGENDDNKDIEAKDEDKFDNEENNGDNNRENNGENNGEKNGENNGQNNGIFDELNERDDLDEDDNVDDMGSRNQEQYNNESQLKKYDTRAFEDDILNSQQQQIEQDQDIDGTVPKFKTTLDMENEIASELLRNNSKEEEEVDNENKQEKNEETGEPDSDDDDESRMRNMRDPEKRKFNVNDILGEFDRDEKGNLVILENENGELVDKNGKRVNEKGYLIDSQTGDVLENQKMKKIFDQKDLDERGEIPPPFNLERYNFNPHDIRGYFERDANGLEVIGNLRNNNGQIVDKLGRLCNDQGYLIDKLGNLVDKRGRIRLHHKYLEQNQGNLPLLFNYKGKKYDVRDIIGDFDKDRQGNIIIRRDKDNNMVDKKGRRVNSKGYLIDKEGNVVNKEGKLLFENFTLSKDNEIPKLFPFLKFNMSDIQGDFEMDPLGNPMLNKNKNGELVDSQGRRVNSKGYLIDQDGNIINKRGYKVFSRLLLEDDGDIPKVFRTGLLRKDTQDSFNQLMSEIADLEKIQEMEGGSDQKNTRQNSKQQRKQQEENEKISKKIDQIMEEENDDDDMLMKELEDLARKRDGDDAAPSDGGNTSVDSMMEDTPSNYDLANQRFHEQQEQMKQEARRLRGKAVPEDDELESEYSYLPDRKMKKKKKKKKKQPKKEPGINDREIKMAAAYGGISNSQANQYRQVLKAGGKVDVKQMANGDRTTTGIQNRNASNMRITSQKSIRPIQQFGSQTRRNEFGGGFDEETKSGLNIQVDEESKSVMMIPPRTGKIPKLSRPDLRDNTISSKQYGSTKHSSQMAHVARKNNLMSSTGVSFNKDPTNTSESNLLNNQQILSNEREKDRERRLTHVANSVTGFYSQQSMSDHSKMRSTHESNFAQNIGQPGRRRRNVDNDEEETKGTPGQKHMYSNDPELDRIYGTARGLADITMLSDWEKDSQGSQKTHISQFNNGLKQKKVKHLESIYLQRLEPAAKAGQLQKGQVPKEQKVAPFRVMHHRFHDEAEWYVEDAKSEIDSIHSTRDIRRLLDRKFEQEFHGSAQGSARKNKHSSGDNGQNIFHGNFKNYLQKKIKEQQSSINIGK